MSNLSENVQVDDFKNVKYFKQHQLKAVSVKLNYFLYLRKFLLGILIICRDQVEKYNCKSSSYYFRVNNGSKNIKGEGADVLNNNVLVIVSQQFSVSEIPLKMYLCIFVSIIFELNFYVCHSSLALLFLHSLDIVHVVVDNFF
jgi:hypothetical protein